MDDHGLIPEALEEALIDCRANGDRVKFLYTVPNFHNPAGVTLSEPRREAIVALAEKYDLLIIEDNPYGLLGFEARAAAGAARPQQPSGSSTSARSPRRSPRACGWAGCWRRSPSGRSWSWPPRRRCSARRR